MTENGSMKLWSTINSRNEIMEVAEILIPYFKSKHKDLIGNVARYASIKDIVSRQEVRGGINNIEVDVVVLTDVTDGDVIEKIILREFKSIDLLDDEIKRYTLLEKRCSSFKNIQPYAMLNIDKHKSMIGIDLNKTII